MIPKNLCSLTGSGVLPWGLWLDVCLLLATGGKRKMFKSMYTDNLFPSIYIVVSLYQDMSRRLKSPSSSYIFERFSLQTCASWPVKRYSELPKTITWELVHLWKNCMKCIVGSMKLHDVISLSLKLLTVCLRIVNFKCQSKRMLSDVLWALQALMFWSFFWNLHRIER